MTSEKFLVIVEKNCKIIRKKLRLMFREVKKNCDNRRARNLN
jgi:hypothetical protein